MKTILLLALLSVASTARAQTDFRAELTSTNTTTTGAAAFTITNSTVSFTISLTLEDVIPTTAQLTGSQSNFVFNLGSPFIVIHSPGPWPDGYDGSTAFFGTFEIPPALRADLVAGQTILELLDTRIGDFRGPVLPVQAPLITGFNRLGATTRIHFNARPPYQYFVESSEALDAVSLAFTNVSALSQTFEVEVSDSAPATARFYRVRRELCCEAVPSGHLR